MAVQSLAVWHGVCSIGRRRSADGLTDKVFSLIILAALTGYQSYDIVKASR